MARRVDIDDEVALQRAEREREQNRVMSFPSMFREMKLRRYRAMAEPALFSSSFFFSTHTPAFIARRYGAMFRQ